MGDGAACGDVMEPTSVLVKWLPFTNRNSDEAQTSEHDKNIIDEHYYEFVQGASCTQGTVSSIPIVGSISPEGFLSLILLLVVIIATVVVTVVVVVAIVGVVIVVAVIGVVVVVGGVSFIIKLSFMVIGFFLRTVLLYQESFKFRPELGLLVLAIVAACASRAVATLSATSFLMAACVLKPGALDVDVLLRGILSIEDNT
ncbi:hypothetical protein Tco_0404776 [Tanacetum coccineum]